MNLPYLKKIPKKFPNRISYPRLIKLFKKYSRDKIMEIIIKEKEENTDFSINRIGLVKNYLDSLKTGQKILFFAHKCEVGLL